MLLFSGHQGRNQYLGRRKRNSPGLYKPPLSMADTCFTSPGLGSKALASREYVGTPWQTSVTSTGSLQATGSHASSPTNVMKPHLSCSYLHVCCGVCGFRGPAADTAPSFLMVAHHHNPNQQTRQSNTTYALLGHRRARHPGQWGVLRHLPSFP